MSIKKKIKKTIPKKYWRTAFKLSLFFFALQNYNKPKVFCISMQRNGTTSCGDFLKDNNYRVASYSQISREWNKKWFLGDFESIFKTIYFKAYNAYEDNPWWFPDFYKILFHRFPNSKFILFTRDSEKWFNSMLSHSGGASVGNTKIHCKVYQRMTDYYSYIEEDNYSQISEINVDNLLSLENKREHYIRVYEEYNKDVIDFFNRVAPSRLFVAQLEDNNKWKNLGKFLGIEINNEINFHSNKSVVLK